jgi:hypothetical protein
MGVSMFGWRKPKFDQREQRNPNYARVYYRLLDKTSGGTGLSKETIHHALGAEFDESYKKGLIRYQSFKTDSSSQNYATNLAVESYTLAVVTVTDSECNERENTDQAFVLGFADGLTTVGEIIFAIAPAMASARIIGEVEYASVLCVKSVMDMIYTTVSALLTRDPKTVSKYGHYAIGRWRACGEFLKEIDCG